MFNWIKSKLPGGRFEALSPKINPEGHPTPESPAGEAEQSQAGSAEAPRRYALQPGELIPYKGFVFQVTVVNERGFACQLVGVTHKMKKKIDAKVKEEEAAAAQARQLKMANGRSVPR